LKPKSVLDQRPKLYSLQEDKESWKEKTIYSDMPSNPVPFVCLIQENS